MAMPNRSWRRWLPDNALRSAAVDRLLAAAAREWSDKWIAGTSGAGLRPIANARWPSASGEARRWLRLEGEPAWLRLASEAEMALAAAILGVSLRDRPLNGADRKLLEALARGSLDDLRRRFSFMFGVAEDGSWQECAEAPPGAEGARSVLFGVAEGLPLLELVVGCDLLAEMLRSSLPRVAPSPALPSFHAALSNQQVELHAVLGSCRLSLRELATMGEGDVLVLDRQLTEPLDLAVGAQLCPATCTLEQQGENFHLKIARPFLEEQES